MDVNEIVDKEELMSRIDDDVELLQELIELFLEDCPTLMEDIKQAIENKDTDKLKHSSHTLKGAVSNFCVQEAVEATAKIEVYASEGDFSAAESHYGDLNKKIEDVKTALQLLSEEYTLED